MFAPLLLSTVAVVHATNSTHSCGHGSWEAKNESCVCDPSWRVAGPTDIVDFFLRTCSQYECTSDALCKRELGGGASCPVTGWSCYCGLWDLLGGGFTGRQTNKAGCMGLAYAISFAITDTCEQLAAQGWKWFFFVALVLLPFGQRRTRCPHTRVTILSRVLTALHINRRCDGSCPLSSRIRLEDEFAWSLYVVELARGVTWSSWSCGCRFCYVAHYIMGSRECGCLCRVLHRGWRSRLPRMRCQSRVGRLLPGNHHTQCRLLGVRQPLYGIQPRPNTRGMLPFIGCSGRSVSVPSRQLLGRRFGDAARHSLPYVNK